MKSGSVFGKRPGSPCTYSPQSCLPLLPFVPCGTPTSFWYDAFAYSTALVAHTNSIFSSENQNLSISQKELLLWHQRLSHANLA
jgi:hypothetical protein